VGSAEALPETRYAKSGDVHIAYQVCGEGPFDVVWVKGLFGVTIDLNPVDLGPASLASRARLLRFDKRGLGASDRVAGAPSLEERMDDVRAVMDAAGSETAALFGHVDGGAMSLLFAATYPERTFALVLFQAKPRFVRAPDFPWAPTRDEYERETVAEMQGWGSVEWSRRLDSAYGQHRSEEELREGARRARLTASPGAIAAMRRMNMDIDVRAVLPTIHVPALLIYRSEDPFVAGDTSTREIARYMAARIPDATKVEIERTGWPSDDLVYAFLSEAWERRRREPERVLATVLFTDLLGSTRAAMEHGPRWRELLTEHNARIRRELARFRGAEIDTAGDGFFASGFDGPARAIRCGCAIRDAITDLGLGVRVGVHTGECDLVDGKLSGLSVTIGSRVAAEADAGEVLVSSTVKDLVAGSGIEFEPRGMRELKGLGEWPLYAIVAA
jgi:class 3 adenylate cyclase/pimeloyl-ACP methyl ester carboxylesterase